MDTSIMPLSGFLLCLIPLALVIVGFIVAARLTDRQATSTYSRIMPEVKPSETTKSPGA